MEDNFAEKLGVFEQQYYDQLSARNAILTDHTTQTFKNEGKSKAFREYSVCVLFA